MRPRSRQRKRFRLIFLVPVLVLLSLLTSACGLENSAVNEIGLTYSGGWIEDKEYKGLLEAGSTNNPTGFGSTTYLYKTDQRTLIAGPPVPGLDKDRQPDVGPIEIVSDDDVRLLVDYQLYFKLNRDEKTLKKFHENLGVKTEAWTTEGWKQLLTQYFVPQIERSMEAAGLTKNWRSLYGSEEARVAFQNDVAVRLKQAIQEVIGDEYFCGPQYSGPGTPCGTYTFTVGKPKPVNVDILSAVEAEQTATSREQAAEAENRRISAELAGKRQQVELYGQQGAVLLEAIHSGKVGQIIVDNSGRVTVGR